MNTSHRNAVVFKPLAIGVFLLVLVFLIPAILRVACWDGRFPLHLDIRSQSNTPIKELSYATFFDSKIAQWAMAQTGEYPELNFRPVVDEKGQFTAFIECSGRAWIFNIETSYTEPKCIVLRIVYENGKEYQCVVEIPEGRGSRSIRVEVP